MGAAIECFTKFGILAFFNESEKSGMVNCIKIEISMEFRMG